MYQKEIKNSNGQYINLLNNINLLNEEGIFQNNKVTGFLKKLGLSVYILL